MSSSCPKCGVVFEKENSFELCYSCLMLEAVNETSPDDESVELTTSTQRYEILEEIGHGGMGAVSKAYDLKLNRVVALKQVSVHTTPSPQLFKRFQQEAEAAACLQHPNIVTILDYGNMQGRPYIAMDFVQGQNLDTYAQDHTLSSKQVADFGIQIAHGAQHAHESGVIHRDLKPSNVMVSENGTLKITDFGLAKKLDEGNELTSPGQLLGTPNYLSPEQATGDATEVGISSDRYAIGAILYQLMTGRPPFVAGSLPEILIQIRDKEVLKPSLLNPDVPRDLETICLKCLNKVPERRYASAQDIADELQRFNDGIPIQARPAGSFEKVIKWSKRNPSVAVLSAMLIVLGVSSFAIVLHQLQRTRLANAAAKTQLARLQVVNGCQYLQRQDLFKSLLYFTEAIHELPETPEQTSTDRKRIASILKQCPTLLNVLTHRGDPVGSAAFHPTESKVATTGAAGRVMIHEVLSGKVILQTDPIPGLPFSVQFSPDGDYLLVSMLQGGGETILLDASSGDTIWGPIPHDGIRGDRARFLPPQLSRDGQYMLTLVSPKQMRISSLSTGQPIGNDIHSPQSIQQAYFSVDGSLLWTLDQEQQLSGWRIPKLSQVDLSLPTEEVDLVVDPNSDRVLLGKRPYDLRLNDFVGLPISHPGAISSVAFSSIGNRFITGGANGDVILWNDQGAKVHHRVMEHGHGVYEIAFSADESRVMTLTQDSQIRIWETETGHLLSPPILHTFSSPISGFDHTGQHFSSMHPSQALFVWELPTTTPPPALLRKHIDSWSMTGLGISSDRMVSDEVHGLVMMTRLASGEQSTLHPMSMDISPRQGWFDLTGSYFLMETHPSMIQVWETDSGLPVTPRVPSQYSEDQQEYAGVRLPTIAGTSSQLMDFTRLTAGLRLNTEGGFSHLTLQELEKIWTQLIQDQPDWFKIKENL